MIKSPIDNVINLMGVSMENTIYQLFHPRFYYKQLIIFICFNNLKNLCARENEVYW